MTHDYKRNGTTTLFAALNVLTGMVIGQCLPRHRHQEFLKFLRTIDREVPTGLQIHLILDNYGTHKHADVRQWLDKHPRFHLHFTPTSSSWLNQVERWFRELTDKALRRGAFGSVPDLIAAIQEYIDAHNKDPKPYVWTATAESILAKVARARATLDTVICRRQWYQFQSGGLLSRYAVSFSSTPDITHSSQSTICGYDCCTCGHEWAAFLIARPDRGFCPK